MSGAAVLQLATQIALGLLLVGMLLAVIRLIRGPNLGDRILALDMITMLGTGFIAAVALVGFLATVALARYLMSRARDREAKR